MDSPLIPVDIDSALDELERLEESNENNKSKLKKINLNLEYYFHLITNSQYSSNGNISNYNN